MSDDSRRTRGLQLGQITFERDRELLLGYIGEGYSGDHVLRQSWRKGGHLGRREGRGGMEVKWGQRMGKKIRCCQLTWPESERLARIQMSGDIFTCENWEGTPMQFPDGEV